MLIEAKALIDTPEKWQQGFFKIARKDADRYCIFGALWQATDNSNAPRWVMLEASSAISFSICRIVGKRQLTTEFNDTRTHAEVMEMLDSAINFKDK